MYERLLVPLDGSELAEGALPFVEELARKFSSEIILLTACEPGDYMERPLRAYLEKREEEFQSLGLNASPVVVQGDAADEILEFSEMSNIGLIAISTHGRSGISSRWPLGSIANKVVQGSSIPVLLIKSEKLETVYSQRGMEKILVPLDGSKLAEVSLPYVEELAKVMGSEVTLIRVIEPIDSMARPFIGSMESDLKAEEEKRAVAYLKEKEKELRDKGVTVKAESLHGKAAEEVVKYADDKSVSLIVQATHGYSGITKWLFGVITTKIVEEASQPILLVRPKVENE
ncbi:MAG: universal stress protein [Dehalococcoidia bacterium]